MRLTFILDAHEWCSHSLRCHHDHILDGNEWQLHHQVGYHIFCICIIREQRFNIVLIFFRKIK